jgi:hypothetical protein
MWAQLITTRLKPGREGDPPGLVEQLHHAGSRTGPVPSAFIGRPVPLEGIDVPMNEGGGFAC